MCNLQLVAYGITILVWYSINSGTYNCIKPNTKKTRITANPSAAASTASTSQSSNETLTSSAPEFGLLLQLQLQGQQISRNIIYRRSACCQKMTLRLGRPCWRFIFQNGMHILEIIVASFFFFFFIQGYCCLKVIIQP